MRTGVLFTPPAPAQVAALARESEAAGFSLFALGDSQSLFREVHTSLAVAAGATSRITLATGVSNLITRHLAVSASAAATLQEISGGRFVLGLGTGDSAVYNLGLTAMRRDEFAASIESLRGLLRGEDVTHQGMDIHVRWADHRVPIYVTAEGPKMLRLAGRIADGVIVGAGLLPEVIAGSLEHLAAGAAEAGRTLADIDVWFFAKANLAGTDATAVREIAMALAASANHSFRFHREGKWLPPELVPAIERLVDRYQPREHEQLGDTVNARLTDELGLTDYLAARFAVAGTPDTVRARLGELAAAGASQILLAGITPDPLGFVRRWADEVAPSLVTAP
ncbi:LLM class flavin-dependent oxidoreductase [Actinomadura sp. 1N219]|uniref:LLM class flavin-dependent oxidoreductase n=1 Tax=Actinomadura sp. 1N219 TaxID=3375152 RepID=UPI0037A6C2FD